MQPELWAQFTVGGQEYFTEGYDRANYRLFFPKQEGKLFPYSAMEDAEGNYVNLLEYNAANHIIVKAEEPAQTVTEFGGQSATPANDMFNVGNAMPATAFPEGGVAPATLNLP